VTQAPLENTNETEQKPGFFAITLSLIAAAFGVQSAKNRERDFKHGNYRHFIAGGIIFTVLFVITMFMVVNAVLEKAG